MTLTGRRAVPPGRIDSPRRSKSLNTSFYGGVYKNRCSVLHDRPAIWPDPVFEELPGPQRTAKIVVVVAEFDTTPSKLRGAPRNTKRDDVRSPECLEIWNTLFIQVNLRRPRERSDRPGSKCCRRNEQWSRAAPLEALLSRFDLELSSVLTGCTSSYRLAKRARCASLRTPRWRIA